MLLPEKVRRNYSITCQFIINLQMNNYLSAFVSIHSMQLRWAKLHPKFRPQLSGWAISMLALYQPKINQRKY